jgi:EAL domain-containing protein (putative c-di-GMP-specific phosphodiesterase class I)
MKNAIVTAMPDESVAQRALDRAMDDKEALLLVYQPIHDARTREIYSAEALLRQRRESGEVREASIINEAAEEGPELFALTSILVRKAYTDAARWHAGGSPNVRLNLNLSPREFQEGNVGARVKSLVTTCGVDVTKLNFEITETSYIDDPEATMNVLEGLCELGVHLWLDDFGTGHSSLTHIQHFPLEGIKLPGDFVRGMLDDKRCRAIVRRLIDLAHDLGMKVIAEEVEQQEQLDALLEYGIDYIQGFFFSKPMEIDDFIEFARRPAR